MNVSAVSAAGVTAAAAHAARPAAPAAQPAVSDRDHDGDTDKPGQVDVKA